MGFMLQPFLLTNYFFPTLQPASCLSPRTSRCSCPSRCLDSARRPTSSTTSASAFRPRDRCVRCVFRPSATKSGRRYEVTYVSSSGFGEPPTTLDPGAPPTPPQWVLQCHVMVPHDHVVDGGLRSAFTLTTVSALVRSGSF